MAVLDLRGEVTAVEESIAPWFNSLDGATIGLLDSFEGQHRVLLEIVGSTLQAEYGVAETISVWKTKKPDFGGLARFAV